MQDGSWVINCSEQFVHSKELCRFSPCGRWVATASGLKVAIFDVETLQTVSTWNAVDDISELQWAPNSQFVLVAMYKRAVVQAFSLSDPQWKCKIEEGLAGVRYACWTPDSKHIMVFSDFQMRIAVWSIIRESVVYVKSPKLLGAGVSVSKEKDFMALIERADCKDALSIFNCAASSGSDQVPLKLLKRFNLATRDAAGLAWSPDGGQIAVWDSVLSYNLCIYSCLGELITKYRAYENALGIRTVQWAPSGQLLAIGSYDSKIRILNHLSWQPIAEYSLPTSVDTADVVVHRESETVSITESGATSAPTYETVEEGRVTIPSVPSSKIDTSKPNPKCGVSALAWSPDCRLMASRNDECPTAVWIWDTSTLSLLAVLLHSQPVRDFAWDPVHCSRLIICTGTHAMFLWSPNGQIGALVPAAAAQSNFRMHSVRWNASGNAVLLMDRDRFCVTHAKWQE